MSAIVSSMRDFMPFRGFICSGLYFSSGQCVSLLHWDSAPVEPVFSEIWITGRDIGSTCYLDPLAASDVFNFYHKFDHVIGAQIDLKWSTPEILIVRVSAQAVSLDLEIRVGVPLIVRCANGLLRTAARTLLISRGTTETGKRYLHQPHRLAAVEGAHATLNGSSLGLLTRPPASLRVGGSVVHDRPMLSFCTHYLEPYPAVLRSGRA
jgi:hypothetical protein